MPEQLLLQHASAGQLWTASIGVADQIRAQHQLTKLLRHGSHRTEVAVRRAGLASPLDALKIVKAQTNGARSC